MSQLSQKNIKLTLLGLFSVFFFFGCQPRTAGTFMLPRADQRYDSEFPAGRSSDALEKALESIRLLNCVAYYRAYKYPEGVISELPPNSLLEEKAETISFFNNTASGTATIIYAFEKDLALLTCAHVIRFPDTIITRYEKDESIQSIAFKIRQHIYINELPDGEDLSVIASDTQNDIALLHRHLKERPEIPQPVFSYPLGKTNDLEWASFVYLIGFPKGNKMVTSGLVSKLPTQRKSGDFLIDANFNRGFSGGLVLAIRDGIPNFELVGMAKSVSADYYYFVTPGKKYDSRQVSSIAPHTGDIFIEQRGEINYGITNAVSMELIQQFLDINRLRIMEAGLQPQLFFR
jgi:hypothetical protein